MSGLLVFAIIAAVAAVGIGMYYSGTWQMKRALREAKQVYISDFREGTPAKVVGKLVYDEHTLTAPLSGRACAYYEVVVEERVSRGDTSSWRQIIKDVEFADFVLEDSSGSAVVRMQAAQVLVVKDSHAKSGTFDDATEVEEAFLRKHHRESKGWVFNKALRYKEGVLEQGEEVAVLGHGTWEANPDQSAVPGNYRETARRLVMRSGKDAPLYVSDDPSTT